MEKLTAIQPIGPTIKVTADATAPTGLVTSTTGFSASQVIQYRIHNASTVVIFYAYGVDGATALANAVIPTGNTTNAKASYPLPPGAVEVITAPRDTYWSGIAASAAVLYITPCVGL